MHLITKFKIYEEKLDKNIRDNFCGFNKSTIIVGDFNICLSIIDKTSKQ